MPGTGLIAGGFLQDLWGGYAGDGLITLMGSEKLVYGHYPATDLPGWDLEDEAHFQPLDVWTSPSLRPAGISPVKAGARRELVAIGAFALDLDIATDGHHKNDRLPKSFEEAALIVDAGPEPTYVIHTGGGLHLWWLFPVVELEDPSARIRAQRVSDRFHGLFHQAAEQHGFHLDNTAGIERRFRLPGTTNTKRGAKPVTVLYNTEARYDFEELARQVDGRRMSSSAPPPSSPPPSSPPPSSPITSSASPTDFNEIIRTTAKRVRPDHQHKDKIEKILAGVSFAASGDRDIAVFETVSTLIFSLDRKISVDDAGFALIELYRPSFEVWAAEPNATKSLDDRIEKLADKIEAAFAQRAEKDAERAKTAEVIRRGLKINGEEATEEELPSTSLEKLALIQHRNAYYAYSFGWSANPDEIGYMGPFSKEELVVQLSGIWENAPPLFDLKYENDKGAVKSKTIQTLMDDYGVGALTVQGDLSLDKSYYDVKTRVFNEATCPLRKLEPVFDPLFDEYLQVTYGADYGKLVDYLSYFLRLDMAIGAPYIEGPSGAGKGLLVNGLSRFWGNTGPTDYERIAAADFNAFRVPFIVLDEGFSMERKASAHIRHLIATGAHTINQKGLPKYTLNGFVRVMFTANNKHVFTQITSHEDLSEDDIDAIAKRFIYFRMSDDAVAWIDEHNDASKTLTKNWVENDGIAKHVLWLNENHQKGVALGKRFVVEGESSEIHRALVTRGEKTGLVLKWLAQYATNPKPVDQIFRGKSINDDLVKLGNGAYLVNTRAVLEAWDAYGEKANPLTVTMIGRILGQISTRVRLKQKSGSVRYHHINFDHVVDWSRGDAQIGDETVMFEHFNRVLDDEEAETP